MLSLQTSQNAKFFRQGTITSMIIQTENNFSVKIFQTENNFSDRNNNVDDLLYIQLIRVHVKMKRESLTNIFNFLIFGVPQRPLKGSKVKNYSKIDLAQKNPLIDQKSQKLIIETIPLNNHKGRCERIL